MELTPLKYFIEVAQSEHVTNAAKKLGIAQPALTQAIHKLEAELEVPLFETRGRNIALTEYGKFFYQKVKPLYDDIMQLPHELRRLADKENKTITLNVLAASSLITSAIIAYKKQEPKLDFKLIQSEETTLFDIKVSTHAVYTPQRTATDLQFACTEKIYLAVSSTSAYSEEESISLKQLENENFIDFYDSKQLRRVCDELCEKAGIHRKTSFQSDNVSAVQKAIAAGIGIGFWPEFSWGPLDTANVKLLEITDMQFKRDIVISYKKNKQDDSKTESFYNFLTAYVLNASNKSREGK